MKQNEEKNQQQSSDSDCPPWEKRKLQAKLTEKDALLHEKNAQIEQLLNDCQLLDEKNEVHCNDIQNLREKLEDCTEQLHQAINNYATLEDKYRGSIIEEKVFRISLHY